MLYAGLWIGKFLVIWFPYITRLLIPSQVWLLYWIHGLQTLQYLCSIAASVMLISSIISWHEHQWVMLNRKERLIIVCASVKYQSHFCCFVNLLSDGGCKLTCNLTTNSLIQKMINEFRYRSLYSDSELRSADSSTSSLLKWLQDSQGLQWPIAIFSCSHSSALVLASKSWTADICPYILYAPSWQRLATATKSCSLLSRGVTPFVCRRLICCLHSLFGDEPCVEACSYTANSHVIWASIRLFAPLCAPHCRSSP
jgi:hypothetical protein